jgi:tetratricopeptide (TPR) repeat protein
VHIQRLATLSQEWSFSSEQVAAVYGWAATHLWEHGLLQEAELLLRKALWSWEHTQGIAHPRVGTVLHNLATINTLLKRYVEAEVFAHRAIASRSSALGASNPAVLLSLINLASIYGKQEKQKEAQACYEEVLKIGEPALGKKHPLLITAAHELAEMAMEAKQFARA